jgi:hypothetical protein
MFMGVTEMEKIYGVNVADFIGGYVAAMLRSSTGDDDAPLDGLYDADDLSPEAIDRTHAECRAFLYRVGYLIKEKNFTGRADGSIVSRAGHDFWLTRCGHGSGFWDGDWSCDQPLTKAAQSFGELNPYAGDDGRIYLQ